MLKFRRKFTDEHFMELRILLFSLTAIAIGANALDNYTTYACLSAPPGELIPYEGNPMAAFVFDAVGLLPGLLLELIFSIACISYVALSNHFHLRTRLLILFLFGFLSGIAAVNNLSVMLEMGLL